MEKYKECLEELVKDLFDYYNGIEIPYEIITSFQKAAVLVYNKKAIKYVDGWDE